MHPSDYDPEGFKVASKATSADCVAQATVGASYSLKEGPGPPFIEAPIQPKAFLSALCGIPSIQIRQFISFINRMQFLKHGS